MKVYRFAVEPAEDGFYCLACVNDPKLYTQARSLDEALFMARDVVNAMYEFDKSTIQVELVLPPDIETSFDRRWAAKEQRKHDRRTNIRGTRPARRPTVTVS